MRKEIHKSEYGGGSNNFHVIKEDDVLRVELTYPPRHGVFNTNNQCCVVEFDQESVRASDGIRVHYDYHRDGYVISQPKSRLFKRVEGNSYDGDTKWIEVGFFQAWRFDGLDLDRQFAVADRHFRMKQRKVK